MPQFATFTVDNLLLGLDVRHVQEVLAMQPLRKVPLAAPEVRGLLNLRGQILITIDMRTVLHRDREASKDGEEQTESETARHIVVMQTASEPVALLVDRFGDVVDAPPESFEPCDSLLEGELAELIGGAYRQDAGLLHVLEAGVLTRRIFSGSADVGERQA